MAKQSLQDKIAELKGTKKPQTPAVPKIQISKPDEIGKLTKEGKVDKRQFNKRTPGSGRKPGGMALQRRLIKQMLNDHFGEEIQVKVRDPKTGKEHIVKKHRLLVQAERLFKFGETHYQAIDLWLNRAVGKAPQPIVGDEDEDAIQVDLGVDRILQKAYGQDTDEK